MNLVLLQIHVWPNEPAQLGRAQPGEDRSQDQRAPSAIEMRDDRPDLVQRRDIQAHFQIGLLPPLLLPPLVPPETADNVLGDKASLLCIGENAAEIADHALDHGGRASLLAKAIHESAHRRHGEL